jgi:hypothetical protein
MVVVNPLTASLAVGGLNGILGAFGAAGQGAAAQQEYLNQRAQQSANARFAQWQSAFTKRYTDANQQYEFWQSTLAYNQQLSYVNSLRNFELAKAVAQAGVVADTRAAAGASFVQRAEALQQQLAESAMSDAVAYQQYQVAALKARSAVAARGQEGRSIDRLINDYARQEGDYAAIQEVNRGLRTRQYSREQAAEVTQYLSRYNSQQFYEQQPYLEPMRPFQPLPTLLSPAPPSFTGTGPSRGATALGIGTALMGGVQTGLGIYSTLQGIAGGSDGQRGGGA